MKLLLTANGLANASIAKALFDLVGKLAGETKLAFIPTAANVSNEDKEWLVEDLENCKKQGFAFLDIVDISAVPRDMWEPRLRSADVLLFGGGDVFHLLYWLEKSGLEAILPELLKTKVYVGISAGSRAAVGAMTIPTHSKPRFYEELGGTYTRERGLGLVSFQIYPHLNSHSFPDRTIEKVREWAPTIPGTFYALDNQSAVKVDGDKIEVVSEGKWEKFN